MTRLGPLILLAVVALGCGDGTAAPASTTAPPATTSPTATGPTPAMSTPSTEPTTATTTLPPTTTLVDPADLPRSGTGEFLRAEGVEFEVEGAPMISLSIAVEDGTGVALDDLVEFVTATLADERGWTSRGAGFRVVDEGGLFTLAVATPATVDELCRPLRTIGRYSCARNGWVALNLERWMTATPEWPTDLETYRHYVVNHEVGHYILGPGHPGCPGAGQPAPIMMQQTKGLDGCEPNGWVVVE